MTVHYIAYIPDCQQKDDVDPGYLAGVGRYIAEHRPQHIVCGGDFADMPSLSSYDKGKKEFEGRRYKKDIDAARRAMDVLLEPIRRAPGYDPTLVMLLGNHEDRINRAVSLQPELEGFMSTDDLDYSGAGWNVIPFLEVVCLQGVHFSHYFVSGPMARPITTANALLSKRHASCIAGHQQGLQIASANRADGSLIQGIIAGSCYEHNESYLTPQGNQHWRGFVMLNDVYGDGQFDIMPISLRYIRRSWMQR